MKQEGVSIGDRKRIGDAEYVRLQRRVRVKVLTECEQTKNRMQMREFLREEGKGLEIMKMIEKVRKEVEKREIAKRTLTRRYIL